MDAFETKAIKADRKDYVYNETLYICEMWVGVTATFMWYSYLLQCLYTINFLNFISFIWIDNIS